MRFRMNGDGADALVEPSDGIYLLNLQITSTQPGLDPSSVISFRIVQERVVGRRVVPRWGVLASIRRSCNTWRFPNRQRPCSRVRFRSDYGTAIAATT